MTNTEKWWRQELTQAVPINIRATLQDETVIEIDTTDILLKVSEVVDGIVEKATLKERERINQYFADKAEYDTDTDCTIITDRVYHRAFNPDGCNSVNSCDDCPKKI